MKEIIIATSNPNKVREFKEMLEPLGFDVKSLKDLNLDIEIVEDGTTFKANAFKKCKSVYDVLKKAVIADDSGICVEAMNNEPGVYSARFLGEDTSYDYKNNYIINKIKDNPNKKAKYVCAICYIDKNGEDYSFVGECHGLINKEPIGHNGFGYDPIFYYPPFKTTLANVSDAQKNEISHRRIALDKLLEYLKND